MIDLKELKFVILKYFQNPVIDQELTFTKPVNEFLNKKIVEFKSYLEYGSGSSTVAFSNLKYLSIVSVESDSVYARAVSKAVKSKSTETRVFTSETGPTGFWGVPLFSKTDKETGLKYVNTPWRNLGEDYIPEVVLVDGRYRVACALNILLKYANKKKFMILFDDYVGRDEYLIVQSYFPSYHNIDRMGVFEYNLETIDETTYYKLKGDFQKYLKEYV